MILNFKVPLGGAPSVEVRDGMWRPGTRSHRGAGRSCHGGGTSCAVVEAGTPKIALVGSPNVGKSVVFNRLTGVYVTVSNYPGTTVEVSRGRAVIGGRLFEVIDTPGMYSLSPITEEERVARNLLLEEHPEIVVHVVDAKNLVRMLPLTLQLIETGLPLILDVNIVDEAERLGIEIDAGALEQLLGIPVVLTVSIRGKGIELLKRRASELVGHDRKAS